MECAPPPAEHLPETAEEMLAEMSRRWQWYKEEGGLRPDDALLEAGKDLDAMTQALVRGTDDVLCDVCSRWGKRDKLKGGAVLWDADCTLTLVCGDCYAGLVIKRDLSNPRYATAILQSVAVNCRDVILAFPPTRSFWREGRMARELISSGPHPEGGYVVVYDHPEGGTYRYPPRTKRPTDVLACDGCSTVFERRARKLYLCSGCRVVRYCSRSCQSRGWEHHKVQCKLFALKGRK